MENVKSQNTRFFTTLVITLILMIGVGFLPPFASVTPVGMKILGVFVGVIFAWVRGEIIWSGILTIVMLPLFGISTVADQFMAAFGNSNIATALACMVFCYVFETCGLMKELARWIVGRRIAQKGKYWLLTMFLIAAYILGAFAQQAISTTFILWVLFYEIAKEIDAKPWEPFTECALIGVVVAGCAGVATVPFGYFTVTGLGIVAEYDPTVSDTYFVIHAVVLLLFALLFIPALVAVLKFLVRPRSSAVLKKQEPYRIDFTSAQRKAMFFMIAMTLVMVIPNLCPQDTWIYDIFVSKLNTLGILLLTCVIMMVTREGGKPLLDIGDALNHMQWELIVLMGSALALCNLLTLEEAGIMQTIIDWFTPLLGGMSEVGLIIMFGLITLVMTNMINDFVTLTIMLPIGASFYVEMGGHAAVLLAIACAAAMQGCFMPSGSVQGAMMHGNRDWIKSKDVYKYVLIMEIVFGICLSVIGALATVFFAN